MTRDIYDMELIDFKDTCTIVRETGEVDEYDNPITETVYEGPCLYEEGGNSYPDRIVVRSPLVFLPTNDVLIEIDDIISVTTFKGREINGVAENVRDISMKMKPMNITRIELKRAVGEWYDKSSGHTA